MGFDIGVYLVVFGGAMLILSMMGTVKPPKARKRVVVLPSGAEAS